jgi:DNA gyrase/topoisomerase IV subunit A
VGALEVVESDEVTVVTSSGGAISLAASKVPEQGRRTRGSKVVRLAAGDRVVEVTRSIGKEEDDDGSGRSSGGGEGIGEAEGGEDESGNFGSDDGGAVLESVQAAIAQERQPAANRESGGKPKRRGRGSAKEETEGLDLFEG